MVTMVLRACSPSLAFFVTVRSLSDVLDPANRFLGWFYANVGGVFFLRASFRSKLHRFEVGIDSKMSLFQQVAYSTWKRAKKEQKMTRFQDEYVNFKITRMNPRGRLRRRRNLRRVPTTSDNPAVPFFGRGVQKWPSSIQILVAKPLFDSIFSWNCL